MATAMVALPDGERVVVARRRLRLNAKLLARESEGTNRPVLA